MIMCDRNMQSGSRLPVPFAEKLLPAPVSGGFRMKEYWVWCGSAIRAEDGKYYLFASRWTKKLPFHPGWLIESEVVRAVADRPEGPYTFEEVVLPARGADFWDGRSTHNPQIRRHDGVYILFYTGMTHPFSDPESPGSIALDDPRVIASRASKRIGIAVSKSVFGPWQRMDAPVLPTRPQKFDSFLTSNPAPVLHGDGSVTLIYKARAYKPRPYQGQMHGNMTIGVARASFYAGPYAHCRETPVFTPEQHIEDPFVWHDQNGFYMIAKDMDGVLCGERHGGMYATSADGIDWILHQGVQSYSRTVRWDNGKTITMGSLERPFILFEAGKPAYMFFAAADGPGGFDRAGETWNMVIPLKQ